MTYQQKRASVHEQKRDRCRRDRSDCDVATKPKHIVTAWIAILGFPPDNGGEQCFGR
jgi:hypothetical protein